MTAYYFHNIPNSQALGYTLVISILLSGLLIRAVYWLSDNYKLQFYPDNHTYLAVVGKRWYVNCCLISVIITSLLAFRITASVFGESTNNYFSIPYMSIGWWCIIRIMLCSFSCLSACLFDSNIFFRIYCISSYIILSLLDMFSELSLIQPYNCMVNGTCTRIQSDYIGVNLMIWRDLLSIILNLTALALSSWLLAVYGWNQSNQLYLPKLEHRMVSQRLIQLNVDGKLNDRQKKKYVA